MPIAMTIPDEVIVALISLVGVVGAPVAIIFVKWLLRIQENVEQVNEAVNHRHKKHGPEAPTLYDRVIDLVEKTGDVDRKVDEIVEWKSGYSGGPLESGVKVKTFVDSTRQQLENHEQRIGELEHK